MERTNKKPSSVPTNYVTILELKERWLKEKERQRDEEERQRKEKEQEEEELRQQKLREEQGKQQKQNAVVLKARTDSRPTDRGNQTQFRPVDRRSVSEREGAELEGKKQPVVQKTEADFKPWNRSGRTKFGPVNRTVSECEGAELEGKKNEEPEEKKLWKKKKSKNKKNVRAEKGEVNEKECIVDAPQASCEKGDNQATGKEEKRPEIEIRAKSENVLPTAEIVPKFRDLSVNGETGKGDDKLKRPRIVDRRGNGGIRGYYERPGRCDMQKQRGYAGRVWVKKGEVADDNGSGVQQSLERNDVISGENLFV